MGTSKRPCPWGRFFAAGALALFVVLAVRAVDPDRWSDWSFGEAGTMLTMRHWQEQGWVANYLLYIPQGYAKPIRHLDDPDLRRHGHGISPGSSPRVGPRLWYTHYPPGYLIPYALLAKAGLGTMAAWRLLSLAMSFAALTLMYLVFARLSAAPVAFVAALFYALSPAFLGYADAIANQPIDDLLRFGFMLAVVLSTRAVSSRARRAALLVAWSIEFALSLCSYDSVFFVFLWLVGWDLLERRRFAWWKYLIFGAGPVAAFGLLYLQNAWYLGWADAARDLRDTFLLKSPIAVSEWNVEAGWLGSTRRAVAQVLDSLYPRPWILILIAAVYGIRRAFRVEKRGNSTPTFGSIVLLFLCGASFEIVLPQTAWMPYEGRQLAPFAALLAGGTSVAVAVELLALRRVTQSIDRFGHKASAWLAAVAAAGILAVFWGVWGQNLVTGIGRPSNFAIPPDEMGMLIARDLKSLPTAHDAVFFDLDGFFYLPQDPTLSYRQVDPIIEYTIGSKPILTFATPELLVEDLERLARRAPREFSPVLVSLDFDALRTIVIALDNRGLLTSMPEAPRPIRDAFILDLTPAMNW